MSGEINGTTCLLFRVDGGNQEIVGQVELTHAITGAVIDISSKSNDDFVKLFNGELSTQGRNITGSIVYNSDSEYERMRASMQDALIESYMLDFTGLVGDQVNFEGIPTALNDSLSMGEKLTTAFSILSTGDAL